MIVKKNKMIYFNNISNCLTIFVCALISDVSSQSQKYNFDETAGLWFKFHEIPANFTDAFLHCKAEGGMLASPTDNVMANSMMSQFTSRKHKPQAIYTGIHALFSKGDFASAEGLPLSAMEVSWAPGAPDNCQNSEDCIVMLPNGKLDDVMCNDTFPYICYKSTTNVLANPGCGTNDPAYTFEPRTGSCYKFHSVGKNWVRAYMTCAAEGGYLAIPNSVTEANILKDIFAKYPDLSISATEKKVAGLGFHDQFQNMIWMTIKGETLEETGFAEFQEGQPNNLKTYDGGQHCGAMHRNGYFNDIWCYSITVPFICEKDPTFLIY